jgi:hypothetical protein
MLQRRHTIVHSSIEAFTAPWGMLTTTLVVGTGAVEVETEDGSSVWHSGSGDSEEVSVEVSEAVSVEASEDVSVEVPEDVSEELSEEVSVVESSAVSELRVTVSSADVDDAVGAGSWVVVIVSSVDGGTHGESGVSPASTAELMKASVATRGVIYWRSFMISEDDCKGCG